MLKNCMSGISLLSLVIVGIAAGFPAPLLVHLYVAVVAPSSASSFWLIACHGAKLIKQWLWFFSSIGEQFSFH